MGCLINGSRYNWEHAGIVTCYFGKVDYPGVCLLAKRIQAPCICDQGRGEVQTGTQPTRIQLLYVIMEANRVLIKPRE